MTVVKEPFPQSCNSCIGTRLFKNTGFSKKEPCHCTRVFELTPKGDGGGGGVF
jgi:hypothetical protein